MTADAFLILHGLENHRPPGHWQFWLADRLRRRGLQVAYPGLPEPDAPQYDAWERALHAHLARLDDGRRTVICHSLACLLWLRAAPGLTAAAVDRVLLVAPPASDSLPEPAAGFRVDRLDGPGVAAAARAPVRIACSDADPYNPAGARRLYAGPLGAEVDVLPGAGHIAEDDGYGPWPAVEAWCLDPDRRLTPRSR